MSESIPLASDHAGLHLKRNIIPLLEEEGYSVVDLGTDGEEPVDYPDYADRLAALVSTGKYSRGILVCGSGIGMAIRANRWSGIRAVNAPGVYWAEMARRHNNANILCLGGRIIGADMARAITMAFLSTPFEGGRHQRRVDKIDAPSRDGT